MIFKDKSINSEKAIKLIEKFSCGRNSNKMIKMIKSVRNGVWLFTIKNKEKGITTNYYKHEIYFKYFTKKYNISPKVKTGKEMLISNFKLPPGKVIL